MEQTENHRPKILLVVDLDFTLFDTYQHGAVWIHGKQFWCNLFSEINDKISAQGCDLYFIIVSNKEIFDDISLEAVRAFRHLLTKHSQHMLKAKSDGEWWLINNRDKFKYIVSSNDQYLKMYELDSRHTPSRLISHFNLVPGFKAPMIIRIAKHYGIPTENIVFLDDTPSVIRNARKNNITTISFECFHKRPDLKDDPKYVEENSLRIKGEINAQITKILDSCRVKLDVVTDDLEAQTVSSARNDAGISNRTKYRLAACIAAGILLFAAKTAIEMARPEEENGYTP